MKHLFRFSLLLLALILPATALAYDFEVDGIYYDINGNEATVTYGTNRYAGDVIIPSAVTHDGVTYPVTTIGQHAFRYCFNPLSVTLPSTVVTIVDEAFFNSLGLSGITVDSGNPKFDSRDGCNAIIETSTNTLIVGCKCTVIPNTVTSIGDRAFDACGLTSIDIPNSVTTIGNNAFRHNGLTSVTIGNSVTTIGDHAFSQCDKLTSVDIPNSVITMGGYVFWGCSGLTNVTLGNSLTAISDHAFDNCSNLTSVEIPNSVTAIGDEAFAACRAMTSVTLSNSLTSISNGVF